MNHSSSPTSSKPCRQPASPQSLETYPYSICRDTSAKPSLVGNYTTITRDLGYKKWYYAYRYLLAMPHLSETCVSEGSDWKWMLVRKHKNELDCTVESYSPTKNMLSTNERYIQQYWKNGELLKESVFMALN